MAKKTAKKSDELTDDEKAALKHYGSSEETGVHDDFEVECDGETVTMGALRKKAK